MEISQLICFACLVIVTSAQFNTFNPPSFPNYGFAGQRICPQTDVVFLLDQSETARLGSTSRQFSQNDFDILKNALRQFFTNPTVVNTRNDFRVGAYGYSSSSDPTIIIPEGTPVRNAVNFINQVGTGDNAGSWTYRGLEMIQQRPRYTNNLLIIISAQGSGSTSRRNQAQIQADRVIRQLGWRTYVLACQGKNNLDLQELQIVNNGQQPIVLDDRQPVDKKSYTLLPTEFVKIIDNVLCTEILTTPRPTTTFRPRPTPRQTGLCSDCLFEGGYGFDKDPEFCDTFYQCLPDSAPIKKLCPAGTFWDGSSCNFMDKVHCPFARCDVSIPDGTKYPSGRCCNKYYECNQGALSEKTCPDGQVYDSGFRGCQTTFDVNATCANLGRFQCDTRLSGPVDTRDCAGYGPDPLGDPCKFQFSGYSIRVAPGTVWDQSKCALDFSGNDLCSGTFTGDRQFFGDGGPSGQCNAVFLATFDGGSKEVFSERLNAPLDVYAIAQEVQMANNAIVFTNQMRDPFFYYYFFNNRDLAANTAFRLRFRLDNPQMNVNYDLLSNNYCSQCPETIIFTVSASSNTNRVVTATFVTTAGNTVQTSAVMDKRNANSQLELRVIFGQVAVYGKLNEVQGGGFGSAPIQSVDFNRVPKTQGANVLVNKCGIQLGRGPNNNFIGEIDEFAVYEHCQDISQVLQ